MIRVMLAEDQRMVRGALATLLGLEDDLEVVAEASGGVEAVLLAQRERPDVALLDIELPGKDGPAAAAEIRAAVPSCRVMILTTFGRPGYLCRAMEAGASAFLVKDGPGRELADAIRRVVAGERVIDPNLAASALDPDAGPLSPHERDVLAAGADGSSVADIAARLRLPEDTARDRLSSAIDKVGARDRVEAVRTARARGWL
ncbi:response regulator [Actinomadura oligospora]|uniref:response regulator transcription factor n=1 Tax=Actinomadura oligospora TaxID=111804 RepID=UPI00047D0D54|nr:response regulator transcription factor [Actinomadura oligospora]